MRAEIIAIGTELLLGDNTDTNSAWISSRLAEIGVEVIRHTAVGDGIGDMVDAFATAAARADVVLSTGGLGPTQDDLTRVALARLAGVELVRDHAIVDDIATFFASRGRDMPESNAQQGDLPVGAWWLTRVGTAPGIGMELADGTLCYAMPGVPREMQAMMAADVVPMLRDRGDLAVTLSRAVRTTGLSESGIAQTLGPLAARVEAEGAMTMAFLASRGETRVKVTATGGTPEAVRAVLDPVIAEVAEALGEGVVGYDDEGVEHDIGRRLREAGLTLAVAESVTGGGLGSRLTSVAGASDWFRGGLITYATATKVSLAGLDAARLEADGPVAASTAEGLAVAAAERLGADIGISVVGVAGPTSQGGQPVGTVWLGTVGPDGMPRAREVQVPGRTREDVREFAVAAALTVIHRLVRRLTS